MKGECNIVHGTVDVQELNLPESSLDLDIAIATPTAHEDKLLRSVPGHP